MDLHQLHEIHVVLICFDVNWRGLVLFAGRSANPLAPRRAGALPGSGAEGPAKSAAGGVPGHASFGADCAGRPDAAQGGPNNRSQDLAFSEFSSPIRTTNKSLLRYDTKQLISHNIILLCHKVVRCPSHQPGRGCGPLLLAQRRGAAPRRGAGGQVRGGKRRDGVLP